MTSLVDFGAGFIFVIGSPRQKKQFFPLVSGFISIIDLHYYISFIYISFTRMCDSIFLYITNNHHKSSYLPAPYTIYNITVYYNIIPYTIITVLLTIFPCYTFHPCDSFIL